MKKKIALILNCSLIVLEILGFMIAYKTGQDLNPAYYTEDSNLICLIGSLLYVIYYIRKKENGKTVNLIRFISTLNLTITFVVTLFLLSREYGLYEIMIENEFILFHTICPIISLISYLFFEKYKNIKNSKIMYKAPVPTLIYGIIIWAFNLLKIYDGPYQFLRVYENKLTTSLISFFGMGLGLYIITFVLYEIKKKIKV